MTRKFTLLALLTFCVSSLSLYAQYDVKRFAGKGSGFVNGDTSVAKFKNPFGICVDAQGTIFLADNGNHCIRKITSDGTVSTYAGTGTLGYADGPAASAKFNAATGVCVDNTGVLYIADFENHRIRKIDAAGNVSTIAGTGVSGYKDGPGAAAQFSYPRGICRDAQGNLYVGDSWNHRVRKIAPDGTVSTYAGGGNIFGVQSVSSWKDGADTSARFYTPCEVKIDLQGNIYVADAFNHRIRKIDLNRQVTTLAGSGGSGNTAGGFADGPANQARFNTCTAIFVLPNADVLVGDGSNQRVRRISNGQVSTFAGSGTTGFTDGPALQATFNFPRGIASFPNDTTKFYVVDYTNNAIRTIKKSGSNTITPLKNSLRVNVYPNPAKDRLTIAINNLKSSAVIELYNLLGERVYLANIHSAKDAVHKFDPSALGKGIFILKITAADGMFSQKIVLD